ncbi:MAG: VOC family protein, partial [Bacteroidetes bacterium]|nr:VOC family protein [Bacteroidota bacterium]
MTRISCKPSGGIIMSKVVHFEINTPDVEKTTAFYGEVFGWQF